MGGRRSAWLPKTLPDTNHPEARFDSTCCARRKVVHLVQFTVPYD